VIKEKIMGLFRECEPAVQRVLEKVLEKEWAKLSMQNPRGIKDDIREIVEDEARLLDDEA